MLPARRARGCYAPGVRLAVMIVLALTAPASARTIRAVVFDDADGDGRRAPGERGVAGAVVAYGAVSFAVTDAEGEAALVIPARGPGVAWARVPDGFAPGPVWTPVEGKDTALLPLRRLARPHRGPITFVVAADTHLSGAQPFADDLAAAAAAATALDPAPAFFTILGDITQGNQEAEFDLVDRGLAGLTVPYVPVPGNHDWYDDGEAWRRRYGPDNYSFDIDRVHFVVWNMAMSPGDIRGYLGAELARVRPEMTIVALAHAPPVPEIVEALRELGVDYVLTAHTHTNRAVDHGGLVELTTEPMLMGGLDFTPAGYRVVTIDRGRLSSYHRTVVDEPHLAAIVPAPGACAVRGGGLLVAAELDAGAAAVSARIDCGTPIELRHAGGWIWRAELPALAAGTHTLALTARAPSGLRASRTATFEVCEDPEPPPAPAADAAWPQLGGAAGHAGAVAHVIAPPLAMRWARPIGGHALQASPAIAGGTVFVSATDLGDGDAGGVVALDLATGELRWRAAAPKPLRGGPAVAGDTVAAGLLDGTMLGLDAATGEIRWQYELGAGLAPEAASVFAPPAADGGDFLLGNQRHLAAIAGRAGNPLWTADPVPKGRYSQSLAAIAIGDGVAVGVFHRELGGVVAWDRATGAELWRLEGEQATAINASPVIAGGSVFLVNGLTEVISLELATGTPRWQVKLDEQGFDWGNATAGAPATAHGVLVVPTLYRDLVALDAATGSELWRFAATPGPLRTTHYRGAGEAGFEASPAITGDVVWAADTAGRLSALELRTGRLIWQHDLGAPVLAPLAVAGDWLVVTPYDGSVRAFAPTKRVPRAAAPLRCDAVPAGGGGCCDARGGGGASGPLITGALVAIYLARRRRRRRSIASTASPSGQGAAPPPALHW